MGCGVRPYRGKIVHLKETFELPPGANIAEEALRVLYGRPDKGSPFYGKALTVDVPSGGPK